MKKTLLILAALLSLSFNTAMADDFEDGVTAYKQRDFATA